MNRNGQNNFVVAKYNRNQSIKQVLNDYVKNFIDEFSPAMSTGDILVECGYTPKQADVILEKEKMSVCDWMVEN